MKKKKETLENAATENEVLGASNEAVIDAIENEETTDVKVEEDTLNAPEKEEPLQEESEVVDAKVEEEVPNEPNADAETDNVTAEVSVDKEYKSIDDIPHKVRIKRTASWNGMM